MDEDCGITRMMDEMMMWKGVGRWVLILMGIVVAVVVKSVG